MENTFVPKICESTKTDNGIEVPPDYTGTVTLRMPTFDERIAFYDDAEVSMDTEGLGPEALKARNKKLIRQVSRQVRHHFVRADIVRVADGFRITQLEQLQHDTDMIAVMMEISHKLVGKFAVGAVGNGGLSTSPSTSPPSTAATPDPGVPQAS